MYIEKRNNENLEKVIFDGAGIYDIPQIEPTQIKEAEFIPFNYASRTADRNRKSVHFFIDDYQFSRLWIRIDAYIPMLSEFCQVLTPDFSTYTDYPLVMQLYNHYRKHWVGAYMQRAGIDVIPTISWSTPDSFEWCFDGEPRRGAVAVSSVGCLQSKESKALFLQGYEEMLKRLEPTQILFYGKVPAECTGNIINIKPFYSKFEKEDQKNGR